MLENNLKCRWSARLVSYTDYYYLSFFLDCDPLFFPALVELVFALREVIPEPLTSPKLDDSEAKDEESRSSALAKRSKSGSERSMLSKKRKLRVKQRGKLHVQRSLIPSQKLRAIAST